MCNICVQWDVQVLMGLVLMGLLKQSWTNSTVIKKAQITHYQLLKKFECLEMLISFSENMDSIRQAKERFYP